VASVEAEGELVQVGVEVLDGAGHNRDLPNEFRSIEHHLVVEDALVKVDAVLERHGPEADLTPAFEHPPRDTTIEDRLVEEQLTSDLATPPL
jgi:hypothetical protein